MNALDGSVAMTWAASTDVTRLTIVRTRAGAPAAVTLYDGKRITSFTDKKAVNGKHYALFAPAGSTWNGVGTNVLTARTAGKAYFSLAVLPEATEETLGLFAKYAHNHVTGTKVDDTQIQSELQAQIAAGKRSPTGSIAPYLYPRPGQTVTSRR